MEICHPDSNCIGSFNILHGAHDERVRALLSACTVLQTKPHESGRGITYFAASPMFQPLVENEEIPEYRIEGEQNGGKWAFNAIRNTIIRVPAINIHMTTHI